MSEGGTATFNNGVVIGGDLTVQGTTVTLNTATLDVEDKNITLNAGSGDTSGSADGAGITIQDAVDASTDATILWDASNNEFDFSHTANVTGSVVAQTKLGVGVSAVHGSYGLYNQNNAYFNGAVTIDDNLAITAGSISITGDGSNATTLTESGSGDFTVDSAGNIVLNADGGGIQFYDASAYLGSLGNSSGDFSIMSRTDDKDIVFKGIDGGSTITALTLDMSAGGKAIFANNIDFGDGHFIGNDGDDNLYIASSAGEKIRLDSPDEIILDADGGNITLTDGGTAIGQFQLNDTNHLKLVAKVSDADIFLQGNDGGSTITALRLDMSDAGTAIFNHDVQLGDNGKATFGAGSDLQIYHDGTNHYINATGGILNLTNNDIRFKTSGSETMLRAVANGAVELMHDNSTKIATNSGGVTVTGTVAGDVVSAHTTENTVANDDVIAFYDTSAGAIRKTAVSNLPGGSGGSSAADDITTGDAAVTIGTSSGNITLDTPGDIILDAGGGDILFKDDGTLVGTIGGFSSSDVVIKSEVSDKDLIFKGNDGGSEITALTLDMSEQGDATFNNNIKLGDNGQVIFGAGTDLVIFSDGTDGKIQAQGDLRLDTAGQDIRLLSSGTQYGSFSVSSSDFLITAALQDKDIIFRGNDGGSTITALTLDMSEAGAATFNNNVTAFSDERLKDNIETLEDGLDKVEQLRGVTYTRDDREEIGVIAQEVEKILPEIVLTANDEMGTKSVDYSRITAVLIEAVKELSARVKELENK